MQVTMPEAADSDDPSNYSNENEMDGTMPRQDHWLLCFSSICCCDPFVVSVRIMVALLCCPMFLRGWERQMMMVVVPMAKMVTLMKVERLSDLVYQ